MTLKLYYDLMSPPSRALWILLKSSNINFQSNLIRLGTGDQNTKDYIAVNRFKQIPTVEHNKFILAESIAIVNYLSRENLIPNNLYPKESKQRARVQEFLEWQHIGLRMPCGLFFREIFMKPVRFSQLPNPEMVQKYKNEMVTALGTFETHWLNNGTEFVSGDQPTVADLLTACDLEQPRLAGYNPLKEFNKIGEWWSKVRKEFNPHYDAAHVILNKVIEAQVKVATNY